MGEKSVQELDFFLLFQDDPEGGTWDNNHLVMHQSIPAVPIPPPPPRATLGHFPMLPVTGVICVPPVDPRAFDTWFRNSGVRKRIRDGGFIGQDVDYIAIS